MRCLLKINTADIFNLARYKNSFVHNFVSELNQCKTIIVHLHTFIVCLISKNRVLHKQIGIFFCFSWSIKKYIGQQLNNQVFFFFFRWPFYELFWLLDWNFDKVTASPVPVWSKKSHLRIYVDYLVEKDVCMNLPRSCLIAYVWQVTRLLFRPQLRDVIIYNDRNRFI